MAYSWQNPWRYPWSISNLQLPTDSLTAMDIDNILLIRVHFG